MNSYNITIPKIDGIYDIQPPVEPALNLIEISLLSLLLVLLIIFSLYLTWKLFFSKKAIAKRKLKKLYIHYNTNNITQHDVIYQLCHITKQGLGLNKLNQDITPPIKISYKNQEWQTFIKEVSILRYSKYTPSKADINKLYLDCLFWLKAWP